jgi:fermentation-respiration switch protein FrsA (DUF1100 family)
VIAIVVSGAAAYAAACAYLWAWQREIIFLPEPTALHPPAEIGTTYQSVRIPVGTAGFVAAWWLPSALPEVAPATVLYLHGNEGNLAREMDRLQALRRFGLPILAIDYRGYGQSSGPPPSEAQLYEDAAAAWNYLTQVRGLEPAQLVIYGHSLGGAVAADLALRQPAACAIVLESAFTSMADMGRLRYPMFPIDWLLDQRFDTAQKVARLLQPIVIVHGTRDDIVPAGMAERLLAAAREPKRLLLVPGAGHEDALQNSGHLLQEAITQLVQQCDSSRQPRSIKYPGSPGTRAPRLVTAPEQPAWVRQPVDQQCPKYCWSPKCAPASGRATRSVGSDRRGPSIDRHCNSGRGKPDDATPLTAAA